MIKIYEYIITISGTINIISKSFDDITIENIIKKLNKDNITIENVEKQSTIRE